MNEKLINSLMWKAGARFEMMNWVHYDDFDYEKFAQLIVEECLFIVDDETKGNWDARVEIFNDIKKHFGVE
jgi:hypothetical protein